MYLSPPPSFGNCERLKIYTENRNRLSPDNEENIMKYVPEVLNVHRNEIYKKKYLQLNQIN